MKVCCFLNFNHAIPYMLAMNNLENSLTISFTDHAKLHEDMQPHQLGRGNYIQYILTTIIPFFSPPSPIFHLIYHSRAFLFQQILYCTLLHTHWLHIGMIHKDKENTLLCTMMLSMHINNLSFLVSVWLNYYAARKHMTK